MAWELQQPKDKYYVPVITIKWIFILHAMLSVVLLILMAGAWGLFSYIF